MNVTVTVPSVLVLKPFPTVVDPEISVMIGSQTPAKMVRKSAAKQP
jgi:hypothetical protein